MRISDWSSDVCSSDLVEEIVDAELEARLVVDLIGELEIVVKDVRRAVADLAGRRIEVGRLADPLRRPGRADAVLLGREHAITAPFRIAAVAAADRSEEHTSELQSLMRISYAVFCLKKKKQDQHN